MPRKIILVSGVGNSGKTRSIRRYLELEGVFHMRRIGDMTLMFPLRRRNVRIGVASGGDNTNVIRTNFNFFSRHKWDVVVCAAKSRGQTVSLVEEYARQFKAELIVISTSKVAASKRAQANDRISRKILRSV